MGATVIVSYQGTASSRGAVAWAALTAGSWGGSLRVVVAADTAPLAGCRPGDLVRKWGELRRRGQSLAADAQRLARAAAPGLTVEAEVQMGSAVTVLVAASHDAELVVLGADRGHAPGARRQGVLVDGVAAHARCPLVVVGRRTAAYPGPGRPVVVGVDGSPHATAALDAAAAAAVRARAPLRIVCVTGDRAGPPAATTRSAGAAAGVARELADLALGRVRDTHPGLPSASEIRAGDPAAVLLDLARGAGLLVLGRLGGGADRTLLVGSVSRAALRALPCPVTVVGARSGSRRWPGEFGQLGATPGDVAGSTRVDTTQRCLPI